MRYGDLVAIVDADVRRGSVLRSGRITIGVIVHGNSTVSGRGPGVTPMLTSPARVLRPMFTEIANLAEIFDIRRAATPKIEATLSERDRRVRCMAREWAPQRVFRV